MLEHAVRMDLYNLTNIAFQRLSAGVNITLGLDRALMKLETGLFALQFTSEMRADVKHTLSSTFMITSPYCISQ